jgi:TolB-like protein/tetratricopeptide (TPR) repeat protein
MIYQFGKYEIDTRNYQLRNDGIMVELEPKVFDLLKYLVAHREKLVTRDELFENIWSGQIVSDTSLSNQIKAARKAIGDDGKSQSIIKTVHGRGYQFIAATDEIEIQDNSAQQGHRQVASQKHSDSRPSIAVLPFTNLNGDPEHEYISDGITEDILIGLCRFHNLRVISRGSVYLFKGKNIDPIVVAEKLGAEYLLEGSVRIAGDRVRITTQLVDGATGNDLWAETYDRVLDDVFSVQDDVTQRIIATLATRLEKAGRAAAVRKSKANLTVHDLLLRARHCYPDWNGTQEGILRARKLYEQALELDPDCAAAYSGIACTYSLEYLSGWSDDMETAGQRSFEYSRKALGLDDRDSNAHMVLGCAYRDIKSNLELAETHLNRAISANPNDYWNYCCKSNLLTLAGKFEESIECSHEAIRRSPLLPDTCLASIGFAEYFSQQYANALATFSESLNPDPHTDAYIAACYAQLGRFDEASIASIECCEHNRQNPTIEVIEDPDCWRTHWSQYWHFRDPAMIDHLLDGLRKAGIVH